MNKYQRSTDYRRQFLRHNKGIFGGGNFFCSYCGKILTPQKMTVDHLIPINKVKKIGIARLIMKIRGIHNINDVNNLIPSCNRCNSRKSDKMGFWIIRGDVGKHYWYWILKRSLILAVAIVLIYTYRDNISIWLNELINVIKTFLDKILNTNTILK